MDYVDEDGLPVDLPSGAPFKVLTSSEVEYVNDRVRKYSDEFRWTNVSDIQDVDRVIIMELLTYRYGQWLAKQKDYFDQGIDEQALRRSLNDTSSELRLIKKQLGMDKPSRDKERGDDSVPAYLEQLRRRAQEFGINREKMLDKGLELSQQLIAMWQLHVNCDEQERLENRCTAEDVIEWIGTTFKPEFEAVDAHFRENVQKYWIAKQ